MKQVKQNTMSSLIARCLLVTLSAFLALSLASCGGGGVVPPNGVELRALSADFGSRKAVSYSPFRSANRDTEIITPDRVLQDLQLLSDGGFTLIRLFDSSDRVAKLVLQTIVSNNLNMKVMLGVWIASGQDAANNAEIARAVALANTVIASVAGTIPLNTKFSVASLALI